MTFMCWYALKPNKTNRMIVLHYTSAYNKGNQPTVFINKCVVHVTFKSDFYNVCSEERRYDFNRFTVGFPPFFS